MLLACATDRSERQSKGEFVPAGSASIALLNEWANEPGVYIGTGAILEDAVLAALQNLANHAVLRQGVATKQDDDGPIPSRIAFTLGIRPCVISSVTTDSGGAFASDVWMDCMVATDSFRVRNRASETSEHPTVLRSATEIHAVNGVSVFDVVEELKRNGIEAEWRLMRENGGRADGHVVRLLVPDLVVERLRAADTSASNDSTGS